MKIALIGIFFVPVIFAAYHAKFEKDLNDVLAIHRFEIGTGPHDLPPDACLCFIFAGWPLGILALALLAAYGLGKLVCIPIKMLGNYFRD